MTSHNSGADGSTSFGRGALPGWQITAAQEQTRMGKSQPTSHLFFLCGMTQQTKSHLIGMLSSAGVEDFTSIDREWAEVWCYPDRESSPTTAPSRSDPSLHFISDAALPAVGLCVTLPQFRVVPSLTADVNKRSSTASSHVFRCRRTVLVCTCCAVVSTKRWMVTDHTVYHSVLCMPHGTHATAQRYGMPAGPSPWDGQCRIDWARQW
jgi:hypothetical protein